MEPNTIDNKSESCSVSQQQQVDNKKKKKGNNDPTKTEEIYDYKSDLQIAIKSAEELDIENALKRLHRGLKLVSKQANEVKAIIAEELKITYPEDNEAALERVLKLSASLKKLQVSLTMFDLFFAGFLIYAESGLTAIVPAALSSWKKIPVPCLQSYLEAFSIQSKIDAKEVESQINQLLMVKKVQDAVKTFMVFNMREHMDLYDFIERIVNQERILEAIQLVDPADKKCQKFLVELLTKKSFLDKSTELIAQYGLDPYEFPDLIQKMEKKHIQKVLPQLVRWEKAEERVVTYPLMLCYLIEELLKHDKPNEAVSIAKRHSLENHSYFKTAGIVLPEKYTYIENRYLEKDGFGPSEEICFGEPAGTFLNLSEFGLTESDVYFVNGRDSGLLTKSISDILSSDVVGFDSEFRSQWNQFEPSGVAILQFAIKDRVIIFDALSLLDDSSIQKEKFTDFCKELFESEKIIKVGHSISNDFDEMTTTFNWTKQPSFASFVDVAKLNSMIFSLENTTSLKFMAIKLLNYNVSKAEQVSNWDVRPLRRAQLHYAAIDAYLPVSLYYKLISIQASGGAGTYSDKFDQLNTPNLALQQSLTIIEEKKLSYSKENEGFFKIKDTTKIKFLIDNMLFKLVKYLRNSGLDAAYLKEKDYQLLQDLSIREKRIIITRDNRFFKMKKNVPVYLLQENQDTEAQFKEILNYFNINESNLSILSRCVKCNGEKIISITPEEAQSHLSFSRPQDYTKFEYWQCAACKQVYWEGDTFKKSQQRFQELTSEAGRNVKSTKKCTQEGDKKICMKKKEKELTKQGKDEWEDCDSDDDEQIKQ